MHHCFYLACRGLLGRRHEKGAWGSRADVCIHFYGVRAGGRDMLMVSLISYKDFGFVSKSDFYSLVNGKDVKVYIGDFNYDWLRMGGNKALSGRGKIL